MTRFLTSTLGCGGTGLAIGHFFFAAPIPGLLIGLLFGACAASPVLHFVADVAEALYRIFH